MGATEQKRDKPLKATEAGQTSRRFAQEIKIAQLQGLAAQSAVAVVGN